jgi:hypothetical protein
MLITREQQIQLVVDYATNHTPQEVLSFIEGLVAALELLEKK